MKPIDLTNTPVIRFTAREQFIGMLIFVGFFTSIGWAVLSRVDHVIKVQDLDRQEVISWKR